MADCKTGILDISLENDSNKNPVNDTNSVPETVNVNDTVVLGSVKVLSDTTMVANGSHDSSEAFSSFPVPNLNENSAYLNDDSKNLNTATYLNCSALSDSMSNDSKNLNTATYLNCSALSDSSLNEANKVSTGFHLSENFEKYLEFSGENQLQNFKSLESVPIIDESEKKEISFSKNQQGISEEEEFQDAVQFFKDPSSFQYLEDINTAESQTNKLRDSLYIKFDPLHSHISQLPIFIESRAGGDTLEENPEENKSFIDEANVENNIPEVDQLISNASTRESIGNFLISFDSPDKIDSVSEQSSSSLGDTHQLYTKEELQQHLKIHELTLNEMHLKQQREMDEKKVVQNLEIQEEIEKKIQEIEGKNAARIHQLEEDNAKDIKEMKEKNERKIQEIEKEMIKRTQELQEENVIKIHKLEEESKKNIQEIEEESVKKSYEIEETNLKKIKEVEQIFLKKVAEMEEEMLRREKEILIREEEMLRKEREILNKEEMFKTASVMTEPTLRVDEIPKITNDLNEAILDKIDENMENKIEKNSNLNDSSNLCRGMYEVMDELKTIIIYLKEENSSLKLQNEELESAKNNLECELKTCSEDLQSVETTFSNFNKRYEQCKEMLKTYKENEDLYKNQIEHLNKKLEAKDNKYNMLQAKSEEISKKADFEVSNSRKAVEAKIAVLEAQLRKSELKNSSLDNDLKQIKIENEKLNNMYDDLIRKVSKS